MKAHHRAHRGTGGVNDAEKDLDDKPEARTDARHIDHEAEERKHGGEVEKKERRKRKHGGEVHHSACRCHKCMGGQARKRGGEVMHNIEHAKKHHEKKHVGKVEGEHARHHAGHKPRKAGGRATSDENPFTSARKGEPAPGRKMMEMD